MGGSDQILSNQPCVFIHVVGRLVPAWSLAAPIREREVKQLTDLIKILFESVYRTSFFARSWIYEFYPIRGGWVGGSSVQPNIYKNKYKQNHIYIYIYTPSCFDALYSVCLSVCPSVSLSAFNHFPSINQNPPERILMGF